MIDWLVGKFDLGVQRESNMYRLPQLEAELRGARDHYGLLAESRQKLKMSQNESLQLLQSLRSFLLKTASSRRPDEQADER